MLNKRQKAFHDLVNQTIEQILFMMFFLVVTEQSMLVKQTEKRSPCIHHHCKRILKITRKV